MKVIHIVGARPNFMKVAPVLKALKMYHGVSQLLIHTGQHYDINMSTLFFKQLNLPFPDINLEVGSGTHAYQTAEIMKRLEPILIDESPDVIFVYGDVNSTVAAALDAAKLKIPLAHVEAGLRSFDREMPAEINRIVTDQLSDFLFTPSDDANKNLIKEGIDKDRIYFVGNVMVDTLINMVEVAKHKKYFRRFGLNAHQYGLITLHRPSNVDDKQILESFINSIIKISDFIPLIFPVHPRTKKRMKEFGIIINNKKNLFLIEPVGYIDFLSLELFSKFVITDSGGIQEETTYLNIPCLTFRENTERPVTVSLGTNIIIGQDVNFLELEIRKILNGVVKKGKIPPLWDGHAGERIAKIIINEL